MKTITKSALILAAALLFSFATISAQTAQSALPPGGSELINPEQLVQILQATKGEKPLILSVGPYLLFMQAHIPGAEYMGAASTSQGLASLGDRVKTVSHKTLIVLYCGCCPWNHCPNVAPAYDKLSKMGFSNVKVLYIADNFGTDWVYKGYPTAKGQ